MISKNRQTYILLILGVLSMVVYLIGWQDVIDRRLPESSHLYAAFFAVLFLMQLAVIGFYVNVNRTLLVGGLILLSSYVAAFTSYFVIAIASHKFSFVSAVIIGGFYPFFLAKSWIPALTLTLFLITSRWIKSMESNQK